MKWQMSMYFKNITQSLTFNIVNKQDDQHQSDNETV
jgi:hypothetical protein